MPHSVKLIAQLDKTNHRFHKVKIISNIVGVNLETTPEFTLADAKSKEYTKLFPLGKVPGLIDGDFKLFDSNAIMFYLTSFAPQTSILGQNPKESALILQYMFMSEADIMPHITAVIYPLVGNIPYIKPVVQSAEAQLKKALLSLNTLLIDKTYLVGDRLTIADIDMVCNLSMPMRFVADEKYRKEIRNVTRYFKTMINKKEFKEVIPDFKFCVEMLKPPVVKKTEPKPAKVKAELKSKKETVPKPVKTGKDEGDDEAALAPKPKSALDLLPKSNFNLEDWKRFYSNNDTKPTAMDYFWKNFDPEGYSIWKVDYKYNDENTLVFMSNNLVGGFFNRLERARKYAFGVMLTLGVDNDNVISGYFVIRGQTIPEEVTDAADFESYSFVKVDHTDPTIKEEVGDYFAWEGPSLPKPFADGKAFK
ncbi:hypothetical protein BB558_003133 [Smittium angustum]|uniref:Elongation factor 1-gamma n=1 Tax=Smittium angustum TaxID=133377 RepID=A0A2U1J6X9_SMIAN|nr:hypothetical protein BB558_003133 [Smittium angustum]